MGIGAIKMYYIIISKWAAESERERPSKPIM